MRGGSTRESGVWDADHRRLTVGLLLTISITAFEAMAVATVLPATATALGGASAMAWYGWVFSGFMLANLVGIPAAGILADKGGPARPFIVGSCLFAFGLLVAGLAPSMPVVVAGRVAQGFGAGALSSIAYVAVARGYAASDQPRMLALLSSAWVVPGLIGPSAAAALALPFGWRSVFLLLVPLTLVAAWMALQGLRHLAPAVKEEGGQATMRTALQLAAGTGLAFLGAQSEALLPALGCAAVGAAVALPALARLLPAGTLTLRPGSPSALAAKALVTFAFFGTEAFLPLTLTVVRGESMAMAGLALTCGTLSWTSGAWIQERLVARVGRLPLLRIGMTLMTLAVVGAAAVIVAPQPVAVAVVSWVLAGLGIGLAYSSATLIVFDGSGGGEGGAAAALQLANVLGVALGTGLGGVIVGVAAALGCSQATGIAAADAAMLAAALLGMLASWR